MSATNIDDKFNRAPAPTPGKFACLETLAWSEDVELQTSRGPRLLRKAFPTPEFHELKRTEGQKLYEMGYTLTTNKRTGEVEVCHWRHLPQHVTKAREEAKAASRAIDANVDIPRPEGLEYLGYQKAGIAWALRIFGDTK